MQEIADAVSVINVKVILETGEVFYVRWKKIKQKVCRKQ